MTRGFFKPLALALLPFVATGCVTGYNSILMATKTNVGVDIETQPPSAEVSIARKEGTIQPVFEGGQTVPALASIRHGSTTTANGLVLGSGQAFTGGEAAFVMSSLFDSPTASDETTNELAQEYNEKKVHLTKTPELPHHSLSFVEPGQVKPMAFATDTALGLKVVASSQTAATPASIKFGFNRKEAVFAPIGIKDNCADMPSVLATVDYGARVSPTIKKEAEDAAAKSADGGAAPSVPSIDPNTKVTQLQFFAVGSAATNLAQQQAVRNAMIERTEPVSNIMSEIKGYTSSECVKKLLEMRQAYVEVGKVDKFEACIKGWLAENTKNVSVEQILYDPAFSKERCELVVQLLTNGICN